MSTMAYTPESQLHTPAEEPQAEATRHVNVDLMERAASVITGSGLALFGLTRGSLAGFSLAALGGALIYRGATGECSMYRALGINTSGEPLLGVRSQHGVKIEKALMVNRTPEELYRFWRNVENLPRIMKHLKSVQATSGVCSHWVAQGPLGIPVSWDAEIHNEREGEMIAWRSIEGGQINTAGSVHFERAPQNRGTIVRVSIKYDPPGGKLGDRIASLLGEGLEQQLDSDLRDFKALMEAGEVATTTGQASCRV